jgi:hypothetical protein
LSDTTIGFELGVDDHVAASLAIYETLPWLQSRIGWMRWMLPALVAVIVAVQVFLDEVTRVVLLDTPVMAVAGLWVIALPWLYRRSLARNARRHYSGREAESLLGWHEVRIDPEGIRLTSRASELQLRWPFVTRVLVGEGPVVVASGSTRVIVVPRRAFADEAAYARFGETCRSLQSSSESVGFSPPPPD